MDFAQSLGVCTVRCTVHRGGIRMSKRVMVGANEPQRSGTGQFGVPWTTSTKGLLAWQWVKRDPYGSRTKVGNKIFASCICVMHSCVVGKKIATRCTAVGRSPMASVLVFLFPNLNGARLWCYCACACAERRENALFAMLRPEKRWVVEGRY